MTETIHCTTFQWNPEIACLKAHYLKICGWKSVNPQAIHNLVALKVCAWAGGAEKERMVMVYISDISLKVQIFLPIKAKISLLQLRGNTRSPVVEEAPGGEEAGWSRVASSWVCDRTSWADKWMAAPLEQWSKPWSLPPTPGWNQVWSPDAANKYQTFYIFIALRCNPSNSSTRRKWLMLAFNIWCGGGSVYFKQPYRIHGVANYKFS